MFTHRIVILLCAVVFTAGQLRGQKTTAFQSAEELIKNFHTNNARTDSRNFQSDLPFTTNQQINFPQSQFVQNPQIQTELTHEQFRIAQEENFRKSVAQSNKIRAAQAPRVANVPQNESPIKQPQNVFDHSTTTGFAFSPTPSEQPLQGQQFLPLPQRTETTKPGTQSVPSTIRHSQVHSAQNIANDNTQGFIRTPTNRRIHGQSNSAIPPVQATRIALPQTHQPSTLGTPETQNKFSHNFPEVQQINAQDDQNIQFNQNVNLEEQQLNRRRQNTLRQRNRFETNQDFADEEVVRKQAENAKYTFTSEVNDRINDQNLVRAETRDGLKLSGLYSYSDGYYKRTVHYEADENGYRIVREESEPIGDGPQTDPSGTADVSTTVGGNNVHYSIKAEDISVPLFSGRSDNFRRTQQ